MQVSAMISNLVGLVATRLNQQSLRKRFQNIYGVSIAKKRMQPTRTSLTEKQRFGWKGMTRRPINKWEDFPKLLSEVDIDKNKGLTYRNKIVSVFELSPGTMHKLDWKCSTCNHEWKCTGNNRVKGHGCPACSNYALNNFDNRNAMSNTHPKLAEEYQGDATKIIAGTTKKLDWVCSTCGHEWEKTGRHRVTHPKCGACDNKVIHSSGLNSLASTHPILASECLSDASQVVAGTMSILDWKCLFISDTPCGHEWKASGDNRLRGNQGCPICGKIKMQKSWMRTKLKKTGSMQDTHPNLAKEYQGDATKITAGTNKRLLWKCSLCDFEWKCAGSHRLNGTGCPDCAETGFKASEPAYCYLLKYEFNEGLIRYKQGITNNVKRRHSQLRKDVNLILPNTKVTILDQIYFEVGQDAKDLENYFLSLEEVRWTPNEIFSGYTEMYSEGILPHWNNNK